MNISWDIFAVIYAIVLSCIPLGLLFMVKCSNATQQRQIIRDAIAAYQEDELFKKEFWRVYQHDKEGYNKTVFRVWDWGYKRILPKEKFNIIKPYIRDVY